MREAIDGYVIRKKRLRVALWLLATVTVITGALVFYNEHLHHKLSAPDHVIKTHDAQQRIIYGQHYEALKSRHPEQPVIPPIDQWGTTNKRNP